jgi:hypothetical protein
VHPQYILSPNVHILSHIHIIICTMLNTMCIMARWYYGKQSCCLFACLCVCSPLPPDPTLNPPNSGEAQNTPSLAPLTSTQGLIDFKLIVVFEPDGHVAHPAPHKQKRAARHQSSPLDVKTSMVVSFIIFCFFLVHFRTFKIPCPGFCVGMCSGASRS